MYCVYCLFLSFRISFIVLSSRRLSGLFLSNPMWLPLPISLLCAYPRHYRFHHFPLRHSRLWLLEIMFPATVKLHSHLLVGSRWNCPTDSICNILICNLFRRRGNKPHHKMTGHVSECFHRVASNIWHFEADSYVLHFLDTFRGAKIHIIFNIRQKKWLVVGGQRLKSAARLRLTTHTPAKTASAATTLVSVSRSMPAQMATAMAMMGCK